MFDLVMIINKIPKIANIFILLDLNETIEKSEFMVLT